jgi:hypothetical protein
MKEFQEKGQTSISLLRGQYFKTAGMCLVKMQSKQLEASTEELSKDNCFPSTRS